MFSSKVSATERPEKRSATLIQSSPRFGSQSAFLVWRYCILFFSLLSGFVTRHCSTKLGAVGQRVDFVTVHRSMCFDWKRREVCLCSVRKLVVCFFLTLGSCEISIFAKSHLIREREEEEENWISFFPYNTCESCANFSKGQQKLRTHLFLSVITVEMHYPLFPLYPQQFQSLNTPATLKKTRTFERFASGFRRYV